MLESFGEANAPQGLGRPASTPRSDVRSLRLAGRIIADEAFDLAGFALKLGLKDEHPPRPFCSTRTPRASWIVECGQTALTERRGGAEKNTRPEGPLLSLIPGP